MNITPTFPKRSLVCLAVMTLGAVGASIADPLSLSVNQTFTQDSNLLKDDADKRSDTVSSTGISLGFKKPYGRQLYTASLSGSHNAYAKNSKYNNDAYNARLGFDTDIGSDLRLSLSGYSDQSLPKFEDQYFRTVNNTQRSSQAAVDLRYGLYGRWSVNTGYSQYSLRYKVLKYDQKESKGGHVGVTYSPSDLLSFSSTYSKTYTNVPYQLVGINAQPDKVDRDSLSFGTAWQVTGLSVLQANIAVTDEKHPNDSRRDFHGLTGAASWSYTPAGKISYALSWQRDTNNAGGSTLAGNSLSSYYATSHRLSDTLGLSARWQATGKLSLSTAYTYALYQEGVEQIASLGGVLIPIRSDNRNGRYHGWSLGLDYQLLRSLALSCSLQTYDRTASTYSRAYSGDTVSCGANFVIDRLP